MIQWIKDFFYGLILMRYGKMSAGRAVSLMETHKIRKILEKGGKIR